MDLIEEITSLELSRELHEARLLVLISTFAGEDGLGTIDGLTKLAKLDFLVRYPALLERALIARGLAPKAAAKQARVEPHERDSIESKMVRYRFGPWDHRYYEFLDLLAAKGLIVMQMLGRTVSIGPTNPGRQLAAELQQAPAFETVARRSKVLRTHLNLTASNLMRFVYETFPELASLRMNEEIPT